MVHQTFNLARSDYIYAGQYCGIPKNPVYNYYGIKLFRKCLDIKLNDEFMM